MGEEKNSYFRVSFNQKLKVGFKGAEVTSDGGLLAIREMDFFQDIFQFLNGVCRLKNHGPQGGNLEDVELKKILIASTDSVAADAYAATVFGLKPSELEYLGVAASAGLGEQDLSKVKVNVKNV